MQGFLSASQRSCLKSAHRMERDRKIGDRMKVVLLADQGENFAEIAKFFFIDEQTARRHLKEYFVNDKTGGSSGGAEGKLSQEQAARLRAILATCDVPTAQTTVEEVKGLLSIKFSISGMTHWLNRNRFSFKKSEPAPAKADPLAPSRIHRYIPQPQRRLARGRSGSFPGCRTPHHGHQTGLRLVAQR